LALQVKFTDEKLAHQLAITKPKDKKRKFIKHNNNNNQSLEDL
jgi:hypothetical protein